MNQEDFSAPVVKTMTKEYAEVVDGEWISLIAPAHGFLGFTSDALKGRFFGYILMDHPTNIGRWEIGIGFYDGERRQIRRVKIVHSSGDGSDIEWGAGIKVVMLIEPGERLIEDEIAIVMKQFEAMASAFAALPFSVVTVDGKPRDAALADAARHLSTLEGARS